MTELFDGIFDIYRADYARPRPPPARISAEHGIDPAGPPLRGQQRNLKPAADLGMTTVLVGPYAPTSTADFIDYKIDRLAPFLAQAQLRDAA